MKKLKGYRTYLSALGLVLTGLAAYLAGEITVAEAIMSVLTGTGIASLRAAK